MTKNSVETTAIDEIKEVIDLFSKLSNEKKKIALAALTGMTLVADCAEGEPK